MRTFILAALLGALGGILKADAAPPVLLDGLSVPAAQIQLTPKTGYMHAMVDLFAFHDRIKGDKKRLRRIAQALADGPALQARPDGDKVKVLLVEFPQNDEYGSPLWSSVVTLARYDGERKGAHFVLTEEGAPKAKSSAKAKTVARAAAQSLSAPAEAKP